MATSLYAQQASPILGQTSSTAIQNQADAPSDFQKQVQGDTPAKAAPLSIGPSDELEITVFGAPDLSGHSRVENDGNIVLPLLGLVSVSGDSSNQAARKIEDKLRQANLVNNPRVSVYVKSYTSSGISVVGQVNKPGFYPALGPHRLFDILQAAGGPSPKAASSVTISHRDDPEHPITLTFSKDPGEMARNNIELQPGDTVVVPEAGIVYVLGEITRPGGYVMNSSGGVTVLQVVAAAGGPTRLASYGGVKIVRRTPSGLHEVSVPLKPLLQAKVADLPVEAGDILYVPSSKAKSALASSSSLLNAMGQTAIYRLP
ncbi:MAG: polysaccharide export protein [Acidobacteriota bacterium]|nr:polysaccharide export protein [Acidobacteriota bacterium]